MSDISLRSKTPLPGAHGAAEIVQQIVAALTDIAQSFAAARRVAAAVDENGVVARADLERLGINPDSFRAR